MNLEDFEQRLRRQPVKHVPSGWREQILAQARAVNQPAHDTQPAFGFLLSAFWKKTIWPHPKAWAGLGAAWLVILGLNFASRDSIPRNEARLEIPPGSEMRRLLRQQELLFAELIERPAPREAEQPKPVAPGPHSRRHEEILFT